jgi:hypothetical protein
MARFAGNIGFAISTEIRPGVIQDVITERSYLGDFRRVSRQANQVDKINDELVIENLVEVVADSYASDNIFAIRYVDVAGTKWKVPNVEVQGVRLILRLGGVYNGPTTATVILDH